MSEKIYERLLRAYPRRFRDEYGDAMRQVFRDRWNAERSRLGRIRLWVDVLRDLLVSVPREHWRRPDRFPSDAGGYRMSEEAISAMVWNSHSGAHFRFGSVFLAIAFGVLMGVAGNAPRPLLYGVYGLFGVLALAPLLGLKKLKDHWRSYELVVAADRIQELWGGEVHRTLLRQEITRVVETQGYGMAILTHNPQVAIWAPSLLTGYEALRERLANWTAVETPPPFRVSPLRGPHIHAWMFSIYAAALLVRLPYVAIPLASFAGIYLLSVAKGVPARAQWILLALSALLLVKIAFVLR